MVGSEERESCCSRRMSNVEEHRIEVRLFVKVKRLRLNEVSAVVGMENGQPRNKGT